MESFDKTGITCYDQESFHNALNHILNSFELPATALSDYDGTEDLEGVFDDDLDDTDDDETLDELNDDEIETDSDDEYDSDEDEEVGSDESDVESSSDESCRSESNEISSTQPNRKRKISSTDNPQTNSMSLRPRKTVKHN